MTKNSFNNFKADINSPDLMNQCLETLVKKGHKFTGFHRASDYKKRYLFMFNGRMYCTNDTEYYDKFTEIKILTAKNILNYGKYKQI